MEAPSLSFSQFPAEVQLGIFALLPAHDAAKSRQVCQSWKSLLEDPTIWVKFAMSFKRKDDEKSTAPRAFVAKTVTELRARAKNEGKFEDLGDHLGFIDATLKLNRLGIEVNNRAHSVFTCFEESKKMLQENRKTPVGQEYARRLMKQFRDDLPKAQDLIPFLKIESFTSMRAVTKLIRHATQARPFSEVMPLLTATKRFPMYKLWVQGYAEMLWSQGERDNYEQLLGNFPEVFDNKNDDPTEIDAHYYMATNRLDKAEAIALKLKEAKDRQCIAVFTAIAKEYERKGEKQQAERIKSIRPTSLDLKS